MQFRFCFFSTKKIHLVLNWKINISQHYLAVFCECVWGEYFEITIILLIVTILNSRMLNSLTELFQVSRLYIRCFIHYDRTSRNRGRWKSQTHFEYQFLFVYRKNIVLYSCLTSDKVEKMPFIFGEFFYWILWFQCRLIYICFSIWSVLYWQQ